MKREIGNFLTNVRDEIEYRLRQFCGKPSPMKRFVAVLVIGGILALANIYLLITSIYNIGKRDAEMEFIKRQHINSIKNYELEFKNQENEYEYEQSNDRRE